jgi:hypothetical protein
MSQVTMSERSHPAGVQELEGFPFSSFAELQQATSSGVAWLSPRQDVARDWAGSVDANLAGFNRWFFIACLYCWLWGGLITAGLAWSALGVGALVLPLVALMSFLINRPWTSPHVTFGAIGLIAWGAFGGQPLLGWAGGTWLLIWFLSNGWQNWCTDRFKERLRTDESFFVRHYIRGDVAVQLKSGERVMEPMRNHR